MPPFVPRYNTPYTYAITVPYLKTGVRGWLAFFVISLVATIGVCLYSALTYLTAALTVHGYSFANGALCTAYGLLALVFAIAFVLILRHKKVARRLTIITLLATIVIDSVNTAFLISVYRQAHLTVSPYAWVGAVRTLIVAGLWTLYLYRSRRVRATLTKPGF